MRGFDSCYPCSMHPENLKISALRKNFRLRLRSRRRKPFPKQFIIKNIKTNNKFMSIGLIKPNHPLRLLAAKGSLPTNYYNNFKGNLILSSTRNKRSTSANRLASLGSIKKHNSGKYVQPRHKTPATKGSHSFFSSSMQATNSLSPVNFTNAVNLFFVSRLVQAFRYSELFKKEVNYSVNLLSDLFGKLSAVKSLPNPGLVPVNVPSRLGFSSTFFFIPEVNFMKFFSKGSNLIRSSRGLLLPKIARKALTAGYKLSIDSYSLNYFSYKSPLSSKGGDSDLVKYTSCLHLKSGLLSVIKLPKPFRASSNTNSLSLKNFTKLLLTKRPKAQLRRRKRRINKAFRRMMRFGRGHFFKRTNMLGKFFRNKSNSAVRMRHMLNTLQGLDVYRSRFANISSPVVRSYDRLNLPIITTASSPNLSSKHAHNMFNKQPSLPVNEFSHQLLAHCLSSPNLLKIKLLGRSQNSRHFIKSLRLSESDYTNIYPVADFRKRVLKRVKKFVTGTMLRVNLTPWYHNTIIRFFENCSGNKVMLQYYLSVASRVDSESIVLYKR